MLGVEKEGTIPDSGKIEDVAWAVMKAARYLPGKNLCLIQALTAKLLLRDSGKQIKLFIGTRFDENKMFKAHAWVECNSRFVIGEVYNESFSPLWLWENN